MSARQSPSPYDIPARKWRDLAERRCRHLFELQESGRWRHYYTEEKFIAEMRETIRTAEEWARIVPDAPAPQASD
jgi:uncharacterized repeat protein (TIGR03809 family)